jgi:hypothetical protein
MRQLNHLPSAFKRFASMGGVVDFAVFEDASGTEDDCLAAIPAALQPRTTLHIETLRRLGFRRLDERTFLGDGYDSESGRLRLDKASSRALPLAGSGGQFADAFSDPPYGLQANDAAVQAVFQDIKAFLMPSGSDILDWSNPALPEVSDYFDAGAEWWGMYLFTIYVPDLRRLSVIAASTTD